MRRAGLAALSLIAPLAACQPADIAAPVVLSCPHGAGADCLAGGAGALAQAVAGAYVRVVIYEQGGARDMPGRDVVNGASGTIIDRRGLVVTPAHIAKDRRFAAAVTTIDGRVHPATIVDVAPSRELALLKIAPGPGIRTPDRADPRALGPGRPVLAIGTPNNTPGVVSHGHVRTPRLDQRITYAEYGYNDAIELEMEIEPGHSGGPLFDTEGRLIGMLASFGLGNTRQVPYVSTRLAYAIPASAIDAYIAEVAPP
ncbi:MAG: serine protease [Thermohalobaculum sp.]|nr:serine protease [Thermohalobaculum sp.]